MRFLRARLATARLKVAREEKMSLQGKHARSSSGSPVEKETKQQKPYESPCESSHSLVTNETGPSQRESEAAEAARARLYGTKTQTQAEATTARLPTGPEPAPVVEIEYVPTELLQPVEDASSEMAAALQSLQSAEWTTVCSGLLLLRRVTVHGKEEVWSHMTPVIPLLLKAVKSLRSSVSKSAIMSVADIVQTFGDDVLPYLDMGGAASPTSSILSQLLLKGSSNDKRFVIEETQRALQVTADSVSPLKLLDRLLPYAVHKSPKVRGAAATTIAASAHRLQAEDWRALGIESLLHVAGRTICDNTPEARTAARRLILTLHAAYRAQVEEKENTEELSTPINSPRDTKPSATMDKQKEKGQLAATWEAQCKACLGAAQAAAVLKATP